VDKTKAKTVNNSPLNLDKDPKVRNLVNEARLNTKKRLEAERRLKKHDVQTDLKAKLQEESKL